MVGLSKELSVAFRERAVNAAMEHFFSNVGDEDWPDDPVAFLDKHSAEHGDQEAAVLGFEDENGFCMTVWAPFDEYCSVIDFCELIQTFVSARIEEYEAVFRDTRDYIKNISS